MNSPIEIERMKINQIDGSIIKLLDMRFNVVKTILEIKKQNQMQIFQASREQEVLKRVSSQSNNPKFTCEVFRIIMQQSRKFQEEIK